jgi:hypothetical protein
MNSRKMFLCLFCLTAIITAFFFPSRPEAKDDSRFLYVASPGIRNYTEFGGVGILVFDINNNHKFVKRIPTWDWKPGDKAENVKGIEASAKTAKIYVSTPQRVACFDLLTEKKVWEKEYEGGADRMSLSPDGQILYIPSFEKEHWHAVNAMTGEVLKKIVTNSGAHNTIYGANGKEVYLAGLKSPLLYVADPTTHTAPKTVGPFGDMIRPFTVNGKQSLVFVNVNNLLGFEIGGLQTGKKLYRVEVQGYQKGPVKRHGCPSHGIGLTPDETEIWLADGYNESMHVFDVTQMPPKQIKSLKLREQPGWITFSIDGKYAYPSTGEIFETKTKRMVTALSDEEGRPVHSEKMLEIDFANGKPIRTGDQFGIGQKR